MIRSERSAAFTRRQLRLPDNVDPSQIKAEYKNGTLQVEVRATIAVNPFGMAMCGCIGGRVAVVANGT